MKAARDNRFVIAFTGGGTGGHVYPGLAVAARLRELFVSKGRDPASLRFVWLGSGKDLERAPVEAAGLEFFAVPSGKLRRSLSPANIPDLFKVVAGFFVARAILARLKPALLFSKGGYVSVPPCRAAASLGIPVFTHESDVTPGLATRLNLSVASEIYVGYGRTKDFVPEAARARVVVSGNPVRPEIKGGDAARGRSWLGLPEGVPIVLVVGGSQGARQVNELVAASLTALTARAVVVHQYGAGNAPAAPADPAVAARYRPFEYIRGELPDVLAAAAVVAGRAGAGTIWEAAALGKPMVLVPLAGAGTRGDQVDNARHVASLGAAVALVGPDATAEAFRDALLGVLGDPERLAAMGAASAALDEKDAALFIAQRLYHRLVREERS